LPLDDLYPNPKKASPDSLSEDLSANPAPTSGVRGSISLEKIVVLSQKELVFREETQ
jgi:hypothetical protein